MVGNAGHIWSQVEVAATVSSYLEMLQLELAGIPYNKSRENETLRLGLDGRTKAAVEFKHQNISAVMLKLGWIPIAGYKPASNYQLILADEVAHQLSADSKVSAATERALANRLLNAPVEPVGSIDVVSAPHIELGNQDWAPRDVGVHRDYVLRDGQNRVLGLIGEKSIVRFERERLTALGKDDLAAQVEHVAQTRGDGLGFDVFSFEADGGPRRIEVKTTRYRREMPFFVSQNEVSASAHYGDSFHLYRLFQFEKEPGLFTLRGSLEASCDIRPTQYIAASRG